VTPIALLNTHKDGGDDPVMSGLLTNDTRNPPSELKRGDFRMTRAERNKFYPFVKQDGLSQAKHSQGDRSRQSLS
jgi:hypothetical protein